MKPKKDISKFEVFRTKGATPFMNTVSFIDDDSYNLVAELGSRPECMKPRIKDKLGANGDNAIFSILDILEGSRLVRDDG